MGKYFVTSRINNFTVVKFLFSEISMEDAQEFKSIFYSLISDNNNKFIVNLEKCSFLPSIALGILISFNTKAKEKNGRVLFCKLTEQVNAIFKITKLNEVFETCKTEEDAVELFNQ